MDRHRSFVDKGPRTMRRPQQLLSWILFSLTLAMIASLGMSKGAYADMPPAGTPIGNAATATYTDNTGAQRNATSNEVITTVNQVRMVDLQDDRSLQAGPGAPVYFPHTVTNTGNGNDTYYLTAVEGSSTGIENIQIFADANGDGMPDSTTPIPVDPGPNAPLTPELAAGESFSFVVAAKVPDDASTSGTSFTVDVTAVSTADGDINDDNTDTVTVTNVAVVNVTKSIDTSTSISPSDTDITYTLTYYNNGKSDATNLVIQDTLDSRLEFATGANGSNGQWSQRSTVLTDTGDGPETGNGTATIDYSVSGSTVTAIISNVPFNTSGQSGSSGWISFKVRVKANQLPGEIPNHAGFRYYNGSSTVPTAPDFYNTNIVNLKVLPSVAVTMGVDQVIASANQGDTIYFHNTVENLGNGIDTFNVTYDEVNASFPLGTTFALYNGNNVGPSSLLQDTNGDTVPDTGQLAASTDGGLTGGVAHVWLQVTLPPYADGTNGGAGPYNITKTATSVTNPNVSDDQVDTLTAITASSVDLISLNHNTTYADEGIGIGPESDSVELQAGDPGTTVVYQLQMQNKSAVPDNFDLLVSGDGNTWVQNPDLQAQNSNLPAGTTVVFKNSAGAIITNTGNIVKTNGTVNYTAEVTIPAGAGPVTDAAIYFRAKSPNTGALDRIRDGLTVYTYEDVLIEPNHTGQTYPGNSIVYVHTVTNNSNVAKTVGLSTTNSGASQGFTSLIYADGTVDGSVTAALNGILEENDGDPILSIDLLPGESRIIFTKVFASAGATPGNMDVSTVNGSYTLTGGANQSPNSGNGLLSATDTTTVVLGQLTLEKKQAKEADDFNGLTLNNLTQDPGDGIWYRIQVTNNGTAPINHVVVTDVTPAFTTYDSSNPATPSGGPNTYLYGMDAGWIVEGTTSWTYAGATVVTPGNTNSGVMTFDLGASGGLPNAGELLPGQTVYIYYSVKINE